MRFSSFTPSASSWRASVHDIRLLPAAMAAAHARDDAETARMIAALGDFHVGEMSGREPKTRRGEIGNVSGPGVDVQQAERDEAARLRLRLAWRRFACRDVA